jgi:hypothetical protein
MKKTIRSCFAILSIIIFSSCASSYRPSNIFGGFYETQLAENVFTVGFSGNGYTSSDRATNLCLLRCAEISKIKGFDYFIIQNSSEQVSQSTYTTPLQSKTTGTVNSYGNTSYGNFNTQYSGGQTYVYNKPSAKNTIICFKEKPEINTIIYNNDFIISSLKSKYGIK